MGSSEFKEIEILKVTGERQHDATLQSVEDFIQNEATVAYHHDHPTIQSKEVVEECCIQTSTKSETDVAHPRFQKPKPEAVLQQYEEEHYYFCTQCRLYFGPDIEGLQLHFKEDRIKHAPKDSCVYCEGPVYTYRLNGKELLYHYCSNPS